MIIEMGQKHTIVPRVLEFNMLQIIVIFYLASLMCYSSSRINLVAVRILLDLN